MSRERYPFKGWKQAKDRSHQRRPPPRRPFGTPGPVRPETPLPRVSLPAILRIDFDDDLKASPALPPNLPDDRLNAICRPRADSENLNELRSEEK